MFWIFIPSIYFYIGPCFGLLNNLAQCRMRAMFCATTLFLANVGNLVIAPPLIGTLSDWFAPQPHLERRLAAPCDAVPRADRPVGDRPPLHLRARHRQGSAAGARFPF